MEHQAGTAVVIDSVMVGLFAIYLIGSRKADSQIEGLVRDSSSSRHGIP
jgi:hypothetical protein